MTLPDELEKFGALLEALAANAEQFALQSDSYGPGVQRAAFVAYAGALRAARGYLGAIQKLSEAHDHATEHHD